MTLRPEIASVWVKLIEESSRRDGAQRRLSESSMAFGYALAEGIMGVFKALLRAVLMSMPDNPADLGPPLISLGTFADPTSAATELAGIIAIDKA
eukprot:CAMPEP_0194522864 /NCGR_PEP_ID=MMETSP0253-20130528/57580_1 /TAXON_ID=2966 /ORGANISM="Noctiluca scintillans" /LENGTH=94 /DNA_ID=CAMNT_0039367343 /DNA_START=219 /DNA_END=500 /DNA_ORIENTATION=-